MKQDTPHETPRNRVGITVVLLLRNSLPFFLTLETEIAL